MVNWKKKINEAMDDMAKAAEELEAAEQARLAAENAPLTGEEVGNMIWDRMEELGVIPRHKIPTRQELVSALAHLRTGHDNDLEPLHMGFSSFNEK